MDPFKEEFVKLSFVEYDEYNFIILFSYLKFVLIFDCRLFIYLPRRSALFNISLDVTNNVSLDNK